MKCEERYMKSKTVASIIRHVASKLPSNNADTTSPTVVATTETGGKDGKKIKTVQKDGHEEDGLEDASGSGSNEEERMERLYEQVAWPLGKKYGHPYDAFKLALTCVNDPLFQSDNPININRQRTRYCIYIFTFSDPTVNAYYSNEHNCTTTYAPANQTTC